MIATLSATQCSEQGRPVRAALYRTLASGGGLRLQGLPLSRFFGDRLRCGRWGRLRLAGWGRRFGRLPAAAAAAAAARARRRRAALMLRLWLRSLPVSVAGETQMEFFPPPPPPLPPDLQHADDPLRPLRSTPGVHGGRRCAGGDGGGRRTLAPAAAGGDCASHGGRDMAGVLGPPAHMAGDARRRQPLATHRPQYSPGIVVCVR